MTGVQTCALPIFASFQASDCEARHAVREVRRLELLQPEPDAIDVVIEATAFVKHMVRNIVGTLVEVGLGKRAAGSMPALLAAADRTRAGRNAPAHGLFLEKVFYDPR